MMIFSKTLSAELWPLIKRLIDRLKPRQVKLSLVNVWLTYLLLTAMILLFNRPLYLAFLLLFATGFLYLIWKKLSLVLTYFYLFFLDVPIKTLIDLKDRYQDYIFLEKFEYINIETLVNFDWKVFFFLLLLFLTILKIAFNWQLLKKQLSAKSKKIAPGLKLLCFVYALFLCFYFLGQVFGQYQLQWSYLFYKNFLIYLTWPVFVSLFYMESLIDKDFLKQLRSLFLAYIFYSLFFQGCLALGQFISQGPMGVSLEQVFLIDFVSRAEDGVFRSPGSLTHPNYLAHHQGFLLILALASFFNYWQRGKTVFGKGYYSILITSLLVGLSGLILSFSRWATLVFLFVTLLLMWQFSQQIMKNLLKKLALIVFLCAVLFSWFAFGKVTTLVGRLEVIRVYQKLITNNFFWGLGPGLSSNNLSEYRFEYWLYENSLKGAHNTFLLLWADGGIFFILFFCLFLVALVHFIIKSDHKLAIYLFILNALFYPLYYYESSLELLLVMSAFFVSESFGKNEK